uniref:KAT8 regulatory NSL complex subunit 2 n=1 Tax=Kalanchoe fedtschenkoi TaxID=63787 RepID=A0A7N0TT27_KALFE
MASTSKQQQQQPVAASPNPENDQHGHLLRPQTAPDADHLLLPPPPQDVYLAKSTHLTRKEVLRRRLHRLRHLSKCYRAHYWSLMEDLRRRYREYCWNFGNSPFEKPRARREEEELDCQMGIEGSGENDDGTWDKGLLGFAGASSEGADGSFKQCAYTGCKSKAMALTSFCHLHILSDANQKLYKPCTHVIKSAQAGPIICGKPILRSSTPSVCQGHLQKTQQQISRALKKAGLNVNTSNKVAPKFHLILAEYTCQIQKKRRVAPFPKVKVEDVLEDQKQH